MDADAVRRRLEHALESESQGFGEFFLFHFFGLEVGYDDEEEETCVVELPGGEYLANPQGTLHGGVIAFVLDVSMGHLCNHFDRGDGCRCSTCVPSAGRRAVRRAFSRRAAR